MTTSTTRKTSTNSARIGALETNQKAQGEALGRIEAMLGALTGTSTSVAAEVAPQVEVAPVAASTPEATVTDMAPFKVLRARLKEHKAAGAIKAGVTAKEAIAAGLMTEQGDLPGTVPTTTVEATPAKPAKAPKGKKASKAKAPAPASSGTPIRSKNLPEFKAANPWAASMSVLDVCTAIVKDGHAVEGGFVVGERYRNKVLTGSFDGAEAPVSEAKTEAKAVVAETKVDGPAWGTEAWIAATHPREKDTPRRADGKPTPKAEWPLRIALESSGKFDRFEVDKQVAQILA